jgi:AcrR family transcriptional regulator
MTKNGNGQLQRQILDEARRLLLDLGYHGLSTRRIAGAVGCTATSIYLYFENKDALVHALIDEGFKLLGVELERAARVAPDERLEAICRAYARFGLENREFYEVMFLLHSDRMQRYPVERYRAQRARMAPLFEAIAAERDRDVHEHDDELHRTATLIWSLMHGLVTLLLAQRVDAAVAGEALIGDAVRHARALVRLSATPA